MIDLFLAIDPTSRAHLAILRVKAELPWIAHADGEDLRAQCACRASPLKPVAPMKGLSAGTRSRPWLPQLSTMPECAFDQIPGEFDPRRCGKCRPRVLVDALGVVVAITVPPASPAAQ
ncbi:MAG: hypothetical protein IPK32_19370 [Verrucomicrobiaceae bacterium]|nr:hypothetical protein [Verrucomicrobiaceae bacterium]